MTDEATPPPPAASSDSAGALLRAARKAQGLHIAALATTLKIPLRKLEALEADRYSDLPDVAFTRALAKSACRALKIDPAPVLALLPQPDAARLDQVSSGLNTPFRDRAAIEDRGIGDLLRAPAFWIVLALAIAAAAVYFWPAGERAPEPAAAPVTEVVPLALPFEPAASVAEPAAPPTDAPASAAAPALAETPAAPAPAAQAATTSAAPATLVALETSAESWVQVVDGNGRTLLSRVVAPGEAVGLDGPVPLRLTIGNAAATTLRFRGVAVDLGAGTRDNVARLELR